MRLIPAIIVVGLILSLVFWFNITSDNPIFDLNEVKMPFVDKTARDDASREQGNGQPSDSSDESGHGQANDAGIIGTMNHQYLQGTNFKNVVIEVDNASSVSPNSGALAGLVDIFEDFSDKQNISFAGGNSFEATEESYTAEDLNAIMRQNRSMYSGADTATVYVLYLNGSFAQNENALGAAFNASSFVIFKEKISNATTAVLFASGFEEAILRHEMGHLLGLVNINYQSDMAHEDANHPNHSNNPEGVMHWAVEDISVANIFRGGPPTQFDGDDRNDLEKIKQGEY